MLAEASKLTAESDLQTVLAAWNTATARLERTHETLRAEVRRLTDELEVKNRELARKNRLADLGQMAAHVAHEVRNNLVPVTLYLSLLRRRLAGDRECEDVLEKIEAGFSALDGMVHDLLQFTSDRDPQWRTFSLRKLAGEVLGSLAPQLAAQGIQAVNALGAEETVAADRDMLRRAMLNLALNALDAMPEGGTLTFRASRGHRRVELQIADTGPGLSEEAQRRAFEPFYTTKPGGTGLGLAIVYRIAEAHGGQVFAANAPSGGAVFTLVLPDQPQEDRHSCLSQEDRHSCLSQEDRHSCLSQKDRHSCLSHDDEHSHLTREAAP
jgi:signal transduction histidine kinase